METIYILVAMETISHLVVMETISHLVAMETLSHLVVMEKSFEFGECQQSDVDTLVTDPLQQVLNCFLQVGRATTVQPVKYCRETHCGWLYELA